MVVSRLRKSKIRRILSKLRKDDAPKSEAAAEPDKQEAPVEVVSETLSTEAKRIPLPKTSDTSVKLKRDILARIRSI